MDEDSDNTLKIIRTGVIVVLLLISLIGNSLVVFASALSSSRKMSAFNAYLISMACFGLMECSLTMSFATGFSIEGSWIFGDFLMGFNACFTQLQNIGVLLTIAAMTTDRYLVVCKQMNPKDKSSANRANYTVLYTWIHAFVISLPLLFYNDTFGLNVKAFVERCLCGLTGGTTIAYSLILIVTSYGIPIFLIIACFAAVFWKTQKEKRLLRDSNPSSYGNYCVQESEVVTQARFAKYVLLLFVLFLFFKLPYLIIDVKAHFDVTATASDNTTTSDTSVSGDRFYYQTAFMWMMFCFSAMFPLVTFAWFTEHKKRVRLYLCCGNRETLLQKSKSRRTKKELPKTRVAVANGKIAAYRAHKVLHNSDKNHRGVQQSKTASNNGDDNPKNNAIEKKGVPVLYAAADGLHLLEPNTITKDEKGSASEHKNNPDASKKSDIEATVEKPVTERNVSRESSGQDNPSKQRNSKTWLTLNPGDLLKRLKKSNSTITENKLAPPSVPETIPTSVVDKRVDVLSSREGLQSEEEEYFQYASSYYNDDETDSELNESCNSRTLILPDLNALPVPMRKKRGRALAISPMPPQKTRSGFLETSQTSVVSSSKPEKSKTQSVVEVFHRSQTPFLPNTPTPSIETLEFIDDLKISRSTPATGIISIDKTKSVVDRVSSVVTPDIEDDLPVLHLFDTRKSVTPMRTNSDSSFAKISLPSHDQTKQNSVPDQGKSNQNFFLNSQKWR